MIGRGIVRIEIGQTYADARRAAGASRPAGPAHDRLDGTAALSVPKDAPGSRCLLLPSLLLARARGGAARCRQGPHRTTGRRACLPDAELEAAGAVIGEIHVIVGDIFDPSIPAEDKWLYRTANKLHINTRQPVIRNQLLFKTGEPYVQRVVQETERILRANDYLYDALDPAGGLRRQDGRPRSPHARHLDAESRHQFQPAGRRKLVVDRARGEEPARQRAAARPSAGPTTSTANRSTSSSSTRISTRRGRGSAWSTATRTTAAPRRSASTVRSTRSTRAAPAACTCTTRSATSRATPTASRSASSSRTSSLRKPTAAGRRAGRTAGCGAGRQARHIASSRSRRRRARAARRAAAGGHRTRLSVDGVRPGRGRLPGAHEPGPDRAHGGRAARAARGRAHRLRGGVVRIRPRRADAERLRAERLGIRRASARCS